MRRRGSCQSGQAVVELALVSVLLLLLALGAVQFGILYGVWLRVEHAAREGARYASINVLRLTDDEIKAHTILAARDLTPPIQPAGITIETPNGRQADRPVKVSVTYSYSPQVPLVSRLLPSTLRIRASTQMRIEG